MKTYSLAALRTVALRTQGLDKPGGSIPTRNTIYETIDQIGCVQIDTLHVVRRSQYLVLWSRLGNFNPEELDLLASATDRRLFEGWQHAASIIPLTEYRYQLPRQRKLREHPSTWFTHLLDEAAQKEVVPQVLDRIYREGPLKVSDFHSDGHKSGSWWNWRPAKVALEILVDNGDLMVSGRSKFQRVYDLTERVLPHWVDTTEPTSEDRDRFWIERGAKALGVFMPRHPGDYTWMKITRSKPLVESLIREGVLIQIQTTLNDGNTEQLYIHKENLTLLEQAEDGMLKAGRTTFLSPFDNFWWAGQRDILLWGFHRTLEAYVPASKRIYGYFCLSILHKDRLIGRFDPKMERKDGILRLKALYLEPGVKLDEELINDIAITMRDFMTFHSANELVIEQSDPADFSKKLFKQF